MHLFTIHWWFTYQEKNEKTFVTFPILDICKSHAALKYPGVNNEFVTVLSERLSVIRKRIYMMEVYLN
jgi:hypothetical protein